MKTIKLISFHPDGQAHAARLKTPGVNMDCSPLVRASSAVTEMAALDPAVLVLDLDKLPSQGREIALMLRASKSARHIPILFAGSLPANDGLPEKFRRLRAELPDIPYAAWPNAGAAIRLLMVEPTTGPSIVPAPRVYTASLAQKLGIVSRPPTAGTEAREVALVAAPDGFVKLLGELPEGVVFSTRIGGKTNLAVCFIRSLDDLTATIDVLTMRLPNGTSTWIAYPKRATHKYLDFDESNVRNLSIAAGLVDYKICSIDADWSAMKFARRKKL